MHGNAYGNAILLTRYQMPIAKRIMGQKNVHGVLCAPFECNKILMTIYDLLLYNCSIFVVVVFSVIQFYVYSIGYLSLAMLFFSRLLVALYCSRTKLIDITLAILLFIIFLHSVFFLVCFLLFFLLRK